MKNIYIYIYIYIKIVFVSKSLVRNIETSFFHIHVYIYTVNIHEYILDWAISDQNLYQAVSKDFENVHINKFYKWLNMNDMDLNNENIKISIWAPQDMQYIVQI